MNTKNVLILFFFILILSSSIVYSAKPSFVSGTMGGLNIIYPRNEYAKMGVDYDYHIHVTNSTFKLLNTSQYSCLLHVYNSTGNHVFTGWLTNSSNNLDREFVFNSSYYNYEGIYSINLFCNSTTENGYIEDYIYFNRDAAPKSNDGGALLGILILIPLLFGFILLYAGSHLNEEHSVLSIFLFLLSPIMFIVSLHFGLVALLRIYMIQSLETTIGTTIYWTTLVTGVIITYFIIYLIYKAIKIMAENKKERLEY